MIDNIFESFAQGSIQINRKYGGTGLGLTIVKNLLELMDSKINVKSELGKGSTFYFTIPFEISEQQVSPATSENDKKTARSMMISFLKACISL